MLNSNRMRHGWSIMHPMQSISVPAIASLSIAILATYIREPSIALSNWHSIARTLWCWSLVYPDLFLLIWDVTWDDCVAIPGHVRTNQEGNGEILYHISSFKSELWISCSTQVNHIPRIRFQATCRFIDVSDLWTFDRIWSKDGIAMFKFR